MWQTKNGPIFADTGLDWDAPPSWRSPDGRPSGEQRAYSIRWDAGGIATPRDRLSQPESVDLDAMLALQNDRRSLAADAILAGVEEAMTAARGRRDDATAAAVLNLLAKWDRVVDARPVVSLSEAFEDALWRRTFVDEMDEALFRVFEQSPWFDDITTVDRHESRDEIFLHAAPFEHPPGGNCCTPASGTS